MNPFKGNSSVAFTVLVGCTAISSVCFLNIFIAPPKEPPFKPIINPSAPSRALCPWKPPRGDGASSAEGLKMLCAGFFVTIYMTACLMHWVYG